MKAKGFASRQGWLIGALWMVTIALGLQPVGSAFSVPHLNWLGEWLDAPPHASPVFFGLAGGVVGLGALWLYLLSLNPYADRRSIILMLLTVLAPCALAAAMLAAYDEGAGGPTPLTWAGVPAALLAPPLGLLLVEKAAHALAVRLCAAAQEHDWRALGIVASRACLRLRPDDAAMRKHCGLLLTSEDHYPLAIALLEKLGPIRDSEDQPSLRAMERCYRATGRRDQALECLEELLRLNPTSQGLANRLLDDYLALGRTEQALELLERHQLKDSFTRLKLRQALHLQLGRVQEAFELIRKITVFENDSHELSIWLCRQLLEREPRRVDVGLHLGGLLLAADKGEQREEGARLLENALEAEPQHDEPRRELIAYYLETGQPPKAQPHLEALVREGTPEAAIYLTYAQMLQREDRPEEAAAVLERMTETLPEEWQGHVRLARIRLKQERIEEAKASLARAKACADQEGRPSVEHLRNDIENWRREREIVNIRQDLAESDEEPKTRLKLIDELVRSDRIDEALKNCEALLHDRPECLAELQEHLEAGILQTTLNYRLCDYVADLYFQQERYDDLLRLYRAMAEKSLEPTRVMVEGCERILARSPEHPASRRELALARRMKNDWAGVTEILEPLMAAAGDGNARLPAEDQALWVEAAYRQGRLEDAARVGLTLADELAGESGFMLLMIDVLRDLKDHAGAYRIYEKASRAMPDDPRLKRLARRIDFDRKRQRLDELSLRPIEALSPDEHYEAAELYREFGQHEQAIIHYQKAACEEELALPATGSMAVVMCECGMYDLAAETLEPIELTREIDQRHPELKEMFYSVGRAMERHKRFDQSVVFYKRVFRVDASFRDVVDRLQRLG